MKRLLCTLKLTSIDLDVCVCKYERYINLDDWFFWQNLFLSLTLDCLYQYWYWYGLWQLSLLSDPIIYYIYEYIFVIRQHCLARDSSLQPLSRLWNRIYTCMLNGGKALPMQQQAWLSYCNVETNWNCVVDKRCCCCCCCNKQLEQQQQWLIVTMIVVDIGTLKWSK